LAAALARSGARICWARRFVSPHSCNISSAKSKSAVTCPDETVAAAW
jgi:hypothetical protein